MDMNPSHDNYIIITFIPGQPICGNVMTNDHGNLALINFRSILKKNVDLSNHINLILINDASIMKSFQMNFSICNYSVYRMIEVEHMVGLLLRISMS